MTSLFSSEERLWLLAWFLEAEAYYGDVVIGFMRRDGVGRWYIFKIQPTTPPELPMGLPAFLKHGMPAGDRLRELIVVTAAQHFEPPKRTYLSFEFHIAARAIEVRDRHHYPDALLERFHLIPRPLNFQPDTGYTV